MISRRTFISAVVPALAAASPFQRTRFPPDEDLSCLSPVPASIAFPELDTVNAAIQKYIPAPPPNLGVVVGVASPYLGNRIYCIGSLVGQQGNPIPFTTDTPLEIASITKTFVATVYELFFPAGQLGKPTLGQFLGSQISAQIADIPLFNLANYTSGLPADNVNTAETGTVPSPFPASYDNDYTEKEMLEFLADPPFSISPPGSASTYSNLGFALLAFALEAAAGGVGFGQLIANEVLTPLGMMRTQPYVAALDAEMPLGYTANGADGALGWPYFPGYWGAGGLVSTPNDLMTWLQFNMGIVRHQRLSRLLPVLQSQGTKARALGWFVDTMTSATGQKLSYVWKDGDLSGFSSQMLFLPWSGCAPSNAGVFVVVNQNAPSSLAQTYSAAIAYDLLFTMAGLEPPSNLDRLPNSRNQNLTGPS